MLPSDQEVIEALLSALENLYVQNIDLRGQVRSAKFAGWRDTRDTQGASFAANHVREGFRSGYAQAVQSIQTLKAWLEALPTSGRIQ